MMSEEKDTPTSPNTTAKFKFQKSAKRLGLVAKFLKKDQATEHSKQKAGKASENDFIPEINRRFLFDDAAVKRGADLHELFVQDEAPEEDFNEIVDQDDARVEVFVSQELVGTMIESIYFRFFIICLIIVNSALIALQTDEQVYHDYENVFIVLEQCVLAIFICEILLKWYYGFWIFWRVGWNIFDFVIIVALLLGPSMAFLSSSRILRILRVLRAFRSLRSVSALAGLTLVVETILQSIPDMANIIMLLCIILLMLAVSGVTLFGKDLPSRFGNLEIAMFSLFICVTQDGWVDMYHDFEVLPTEMYYIGAAYFFLCIMVGAFVFVNLVVAVVVTNLEMAMKQMKSENETNKPNQLSSASPDEDPDELIERMEKVPLISTTKAHSYFDVSYQTPLQLANLKNLRVEPVTKYFMILSALEENLAEYTNIRADVNDMLEMIRSLNMVDEEEGGDDDGDDDNHGRQQHAASAINLDEMIHGDIMSNLIKLEKRNVISSKKANNIEDVLRTAMEPAVFKEDGTVTRAPRGTHGPSVSAPRRRPSYRTVLTTNRKSFEGK